MIGLNGLNLEPQTIGVTERFIINLEHVLSVGRQTQEDLDKMLRRLLKIILAPAIALHFLLVAVWSVIYTFLEHLAYFVFWFLFGSPEAEQWMKKFERKFFDSVFDLHHSFFNWWNKL